MNRVSWVLLVAALITSAAVNYPARAQDATPDVSAGLIDLQAAENLFDAPPSGEIAVVAAGELIDGEVAVVVRNGTQFRVDELLVRGTARSADGSVVDVGEGPVMGLAPLSVMQGGLAFGAVRFDDLPDGTDASFEFAVAPRESRARYAHHLAASIRSLDRAGGRLIGEVFNPWKFTPRRTEVTVLCLDAPGGAASAEPTVVVSGYVSDPQPGPTSAAAIELELPDAALNGCGRFIAAASVVEP